MGPLVHHPPLFCSQKLWARRGVGTNRPSDGLSVMGGVENRGGMTPRGGAGPKSLLPLQGLTSPESSPGSAPDQGLVQGHPCS